MRLKKRELGDKLREVFAEYGLTIQEEIVIYLGLVGIQVSQSTVSRMLNGTYRDQPDCLESVCMHADISMHNFEIQADPRSSQSLMKALKDAWDGSPECEQFLARTIKAAGRLVQNADQRTT